MPRKSRRKTIPETESFYIQINDWEPNFFLALGKNFRRDTPHWEHATIDIRGSLLSPGKYKGREIKGWLMGDRVMDADLEYPETSNRDPLAIGSMTIRGKKCDFHGSIPMTALWGMVPMLLSERIRIIHLHGERLRYGSARMWSISFNRTVDPDDL